MAPSQESSTWQCFVVRNNRIAVYFFLLKTFSFHYGKVRSWACFTGAAVQLIIRACDTGSELREGYMGSSQTYNFSEGGLGANCVYSSPSCAEMLIFPSLAFSAFLTFRVLSALSPGD